MCEFSSQPSRTPRTVRRRIDLALSGGQLQCPDGTTTRWRLRTADAQFRAGPRVPDRQPLLPGDLVFYGTAAPIHHVGLCVGRGLMLHAPDFGQVVKVEPYRYKGDDYAGATRPAGSVAA